jgi:hypothetical protein
MSIDKEDFRNKILHDMEFNEEMKFRINTIVMAINFCSRFNLENMYELLPCVIMKNYQHTKGKKIPYFGIPNCIVSCQMEKKQRGVRNVRGFKNCLCLDFQSHFKNIHIKITTANKFNISGIKSFEMGLESARACLTLICQIEDIWKPFYILQHDDRVIICKIALDLLTHGETLLMFDDERVIKKFADIPKEYQSYLGVIQQIIFFSYEHPSIEQFTNKINRLLMIQPMQYSIFHDGIYLSVCSTRIYNAVYKYKYPFSIFLQDMAYSLFQKGYAVSYQNFTNGKELKIVIPVEENIPSPSETSVDSSSTDVSGDSEISALNILKTKKVPVYKFRINTNGSVTQNAPTMTDKAFEKFKMLQKDIIDIHLESLL